MPEIALGKIEKIKKKKKKTGLYNLVKSLNRANNVSELGAEIMDLFSTFHQGHKTVREA